MSTDEKITAGAFLITVALWIGGASIGINNVAAALVGLSILLITGVVSWKQCLSNNGAWDTLTWFAALIAMAAHLNKFGFIPWFSEKVPPHYTMHDVTLAPWYFCMCHANASSCHADRHACRGAGSTGPAYPSAAGPCPNWHGQGALQAWPRRGTADLSTIL